MTESRDDKPRRVDDGFGTVWECPHGLNDEICCMEVVRPGKSQCVCDDKAVNLIIDGIERRLALSSCPPVDRNAVLEEAAQNLDNFQAHVADDWLHQRKTDSGPAACAYRTRALKSAVPESAPASADAQDFSGFGEALALTEQAVAGATPRTDALVHERRMAERASDVWDVEDVEAFVKHARQLERELADAIAEGKEEHACMMAWRKEAAARQGELDEVKAGEAKTILENQHLHHENIRLKDVVRTVACGRDCKGPGSEGCVFPRCTSDRQ